MLLPRLWLGKDCSSTPLRLSFEFSNFKPCNFKYYCIPDCDNDVPGVSVSTQDITSYDKTVNTGVTCIIPREDWYHKACYAGLFSFNGLGEMTGTHKVAESGLLHTPIVLTGSFGIGAAHQGILEYGVRTIDRKFMALPVAAETYDGYLHDCASFAVTPKHVVEGLQKAKSGEVVEEGNKGGGCGMICHGFKGGNGSSSRLVQIPHSDETFTVACMVQANYGIMDGLRIAGVPVGRILAAETERDKKRKKAKEDLEKAKEEKDGSIIVIIATDAPLLPHQLTRIAKRATVGLSRVGGVGYNMSGDIFLAFSTANEISINQSRPAEGVFISAVHRVEAVEDSALSRLFEGTADCVEEAIYNCLCMAETMEGLDGHKVEALPLQRVKEIMQEYGKSQMG
ncbi:L-aminopeptidase/D-esterase [Aureobasidium pullulans]|uniref:L-aminopeptidase/D-esterase n=1 Tax=Aureobasidium pullulans TaxID=5580 RepID=A0AB38M4R4_AURPU|nr:L-aminopeptidase/D-esterase [Aureobasidium pullulans]THZ47372.1 L-aminopeptidase/D-esterase [Aureobasidium pullulans]